jgi:hypothetical protein
MNRWTDSLNFAGSCWPSMRGFPGPDSTNLTSEKYDEALRKHESAGVEFPPDGMAYHVCFGSDENNLRVSESWDSREQLKAYGKRLMPILADTKIEFSGDPEIIEVHNMVKR